MAAGAAVNAPVIVVPCFNEADRLDTERFLAFARDGGARFLFVDDGSTDRTREVLGQLAAADPARISVLALDANGGKAEAVRRGVLAALDAGPPDAVGFWDADLATPLEAVPEFVAALGADEVEVVLGARVQLLGRHIERKALRHYFGRVAATMASVVLGLPVYDTQCGAKLFRVVPTTRALFERPFVTRWAFDVELLARWLGAHRGVPRTEVGRFVVELPLKRWLDVAGSKLRMRDFVRAPLDLLKIAWAYRRELGG